MKNVMTIDGYEIPMDDSDEKLIDKVIRTVRDSYEGNNKLHDLDHAIQVMNTMFKLNFKYDMGIKHKNIILSALFHDTYYNEDKHTYHLTAAKFFSGISVLFKLEPKDKEEIIGAIIEHKDDYIGVRSNNLSEVLAIADYGTPSLAKLIKREMVKDNCKINKFIKHIKTKYSRNGTYKYHEMYRDIYKDGLEKLWDEIDLL